jgi:formate hydrogenlyase transcriptional activator
VIAATNRDLRIQTAAGISIGLAKSEKERIEAALAETRGRVSGPSGAATKLSLPHSTLESKIKSLGINKYSFKAPDSD